MIKQVFYISFFFLFVNAGIPEYLKKKVDKEIKKTFQVETYDLVNIDASISELEVPKTFKIDNLFQVKNNDNLIGYTYIAKAPSRDNMFDYMVVFDTNLTIIHAKVLVYREDYGSEIGSKRWLKQFYGKTIEDDLVYGDTIDAISGATISVKSMTTAVAKLLQAIRVLKSNNTL